MDTFSEQRDRNGDEIVEEAVRRVVSRFAPLRIVLFGSRARGEADCHSDIDLLVVLAEANDKHQAAVAIRRELRNLPASKDIVVTTPAEIESRGEISGTVLYEALRTGATVYAQG